MHINYLLFRHVYTRGRIEVWNNIYACCRKLNNLNFVLQYHDVLQARLYCTRLELQKTLALSAYADETICRLAVVACRVKQERDEAYMKRNALLSELQARTNAHVMMAVEGDSVVPAKSTATGSGVPGGVAGKKSSGSELGLVAEQILSLSRRKEEVAEAKAPVHAADDAGTSAEDTVAYSESAEVEGSVDEKEECCGGGGCSLADVVSSAGKKRGDDA
jgi:hypothetical protein